MPSHSERAEADQIITEAGGHPVLLDALCRAVHRYLDEHPHVRLDQLNRTFRMFQDLISALQFDEELL